MKILRYKPGEFLTTFNTLIGGGDKVLKTFDVLSLDSKVKDVMSSKLILSYKKLVHTYDDVIEVYNLEDLIFGFNDAIPSFTLQNILMEGNFDLAENVERKILDIRSTTNRVIFSFQDGNTLPKDFILRSHTKLEPNFKTWALGQTIINTKNGVLNRGIDEMLAGYFSTLDTSLFMKFLLIFGIYFIVKILSINLFPGWLNTIIDVIFWIVLGYVGLYMYKVIQSALKRFEKVYLSYKV